MTIVCHQHRFIFIKTRKTAGTSVEIGLSRACSDGDIVTPLSDQFGDNDIRREEGGFGPAGWEKPIREHRGLREWRNLLLKGQRAARIGEHARAAQLKQLLPEEVWSNYHKVTIERNPWDRAVSRYYWHKSRWENRKRPRSEFPDLTDYIRWLGREKPHWISDWSLYAIDDDILADRVLKFESLADDIDSFRSDLIIEADISLPKKKAKGGLRKDRRHYSELLGKREKSLIESLCAREIEAFGYRF